MKTKLKVPGIFLLAILLLTAIACSCGSITPLFSGMFATPTPTISLNGVGIRIIYIQSREADANLVAERLRALGATVETSRTSDDGNDDFINRIFYEPGSEQNAAIVAALVSDIEAIIPTPLTDANSYPNINLYLWIAQPK